jgi:hypothetical protein
MIQRYLISLTVSPAIEETMVDWLLQFAGKGGFTSFPVHGHSGREEALSLAEQVAGRKKQIRFQMHVLEADLGPILDRMKQDLQGAGVHYWISPVLEAGHIG